MKKASTALPERLLTVDEAAEITRNCTKWVRAQIRDGKLRAHRFGRSLRITPDDLAAFIKSHRT